MIRQQNGFGTGVEADWRERASCRLTNPDLFFPAGGTGVAIEQIEAAKAICQTCPVPDSCLQFALETNQEAGIWGGTTEDQRRRLRRAWLADRRRQAG
ncbi:MAG: WhiB family transcriptional regulator [Acidimicrobiales bacterium]